MKIYTRCGDSGFTKLASGEKVSKSNLRLHIYGSMDELNTLIGVLIASIQNDEQISNQLVTIQNILFNAGALISKAPGTWIFANMTATIEKWIDAYQEQLPSQKNFILPNGTKAALIAHLCRTKTRYIERLLVSLTDTLPHPSQPLSTISTTPNNNSVPKEITSNCMDGLDQQLTICLTLINRLSDFFFVLARYLNYKGGMEEKIWQKPS